ncbi:hypothetical protein TNCV_2428061 [Trichonephila clavipes]|nr:hypothetical protein TNCV_2428061 [Trichonephila clavipes]
MYRRRDWNWPPWSVVMMTGTAKRDIHHQKLEMVQLDRHGRVEISQRKEPMVDGAHSMHLDFRSLAWNAASCPFSNVLQHGRPDETVLD